MSKISDIQTILGVEADGKWGPKSQAALDVAKAPISNETEFHGKASSFADPADIRAFDKCKAEGHSDQHCFSVGDNGEGCWGDNTKEGSGPCCAIPGRRMTEKWGSRDAAKHKLVVLSINGKTATILVKDRQSDNLESGAIIDLNPDAAALFGLKPPFLVPCVWKWA